MSSAPNVIDMSSKCGAKILRSILFEAELVELGPGIAQDAPIAPYSNETIWVGKVQSNSLM